MQRSARTVGFAALAAVVTVVVMSLAMHGCVDQNQDNSPISITNSQGRAALSVTCSQDGSIAYVADGRNIYRYERNPAEPRGSWACILSYGERLELAAEHDSREQPLLDDLQEKTPDAKAGTAAPENKNK